jgi:hypothetical protein
MSVGVHVMQSPPSAVDPPPDSFALERLLHLREDQAAYNEQRALDDGGGAYKRMTFE